MNTVQFTVYTAYTVHFMIYSVRYTVCTLRSALYSIHLYSEHYASYSVQHTLYNLHCFMYTFTVYTVHSTVTMLRSMSMICSVFSCPTGIAEKEPNNKLLQDFCLVFSSWVSKSTYRKLLVFFKLHFLQLLTCHFLTLFGVHFFTFWLV